MKKSMKILALILAFIIAIGATAAITVAVLQDSDGDVNVMTSGNVYIEQHEYERVPGTDGTPTTDLQDFTQNKPWIPVTQDVAWGNPQSWEDAGYNGSDVLYENAAGILDKFIFVENTGSTNAYVRTIVAIEWPAGLPDGMIHVNDSQLSSYDKSNSFFTTIGSSRYRITEYIYQNPVAPGTVAPPSLLQIYLDKAADNEEINLFNGQLDVLVMSQAVQSGGFATAKQGLDDAFGAITETTHPWNGEAPSGENLTLEGGQTIILEGRTEPLVISGNGTVILKDAAINATGTGITITTGSDVTLSIGGDSKVTGGSGASAIYAQSGAKLTVTGAGKLTAIGNAGAEDKAVKVGGSGIFAEESVLIRDLNSLNVQGNGWHASGVTAKNITIANTHITYAKGGFVQSQFVNDTSYGKSEPEGGPAIGSFVSGAVVTLEGVTVDVADGGSKCAAIGGGFHTAITINITDCQIRQANGGNAAAGIGSGRVDNDPNTDVTVNIHDSTVTATGGQFAAGIGGGYDTHCAGPDSFPIHTINITGTSVITAQGGKYGAGIGTGYHTGGLAGKIEPSVTVYATAGESREKYTLAMDVGFGVIDVTREGLNNPCTFDNQGAVIDITTPQPANP